MLIRSWYLPGREYGKDRVIFKMFGFYIGCFIFDIH